jgi:DNA-binding transcriptional ArsR family regulator
VTSDWSFLTNHGRALLQIARDPNVRLRDIAAALDITERSAYAIVSDLTDAGYVLKERDGRRNRYVVQGHLPLPETTIRERTVGEVVELLAETTPRRRRKTAGNKTRSVRTTKRR